MILDMHEVGNSFEEFLQAVIQQSQSAHSTVAAEHESRKNPECGSRVIGFTKEQAAVYLDASPEVFARCASELGIGIPYGRDGVEFLYLEEVLNAFLLTRVRQEAYQRLRTKMPNAKVVTGTKKWLTGAMASKTNHQPSVYDQREKTVQTSKSSTALSTPTSLEKKE